MLFLSLHGDPREEYPFFLGWADETGAGAGEGCNVNYPLPLGHRLSGLGRGAGGRLPQGRRLRARTCCSCRSASTRSRTTRSPVPARERTTSPPTARRIAKLGLPTLFVMEGGYAVEQIGINAVNVLQGFEGG